MKIGMMKTFSVIFCLVMIHIGTCAASVDLVDGLVKEKKLTAGKSVNDVIRIKNTGEAPEEVKIYQTDYMFQVNGETVYGDPGTEKRSNAKWISIPVSHLVIAPNSIETLNFTVNVPSGLDLFGTYWSVIMVESISKVSIPVDLDKKTFTLIPTFRYAVQVVTHIGETGNRSLKFVGTDLFKDRQTRVLRIDMENDGERFLHPDVSLKLYNAQGQFIGDFKGGKLRTYPGTSVRFNLDLSSVPAGNYKAAVIADCGDDDIFGATYTFTVEK